MFGQNHKMVKPTSAMMEFLEPTTKVDKVGRRIYRVKTEIYVYLNPRIGSIIVPVGFETNLATVPPKLWWAIKPEDIPEAAIHDYLLRESYYHHRQSDKAESRIVEDAILLDLMRIGGHPLWRRTIVWYGLRYHDATRYQDIETFSEND